MMTPTQIRAAEKESARLLTEVAKAREENKRLRNGDLELLASEMHNRLCTGNHTDACDWSYGSWDDPRYAQKVWFGYAQDAHNFIEEFDIPVEVFIDLLPKIRSWR